VSSTRRGAGGRITSRLDNADADRSLQAVGQGRRRQLNEVLDADANLLQVRVQKAQE
jgi:hypothetical protein